MRDHATPPANNPWAIAWRFLLAADAKETANNHADLLAKPVAKNGLVHDHFCHATMRRRCFLAAKR